MDTKSSSQHSIMPTLVAFMATMAIAWALTFGFFWHLDQYREGQIKGVRGDVKGINSQLHSAHEEREVIRENVTKMHEELMESVK